MNISFENKRILVSGAASGIGRGVALRLAQFGGTVIALDKSEESLEKLKTEVSSITTVVADLANWDATQEVVKKALPIDYLVNSAGLVDVVSIAGITEESYQRIFDVNIKGLISVTQAVVKDLLDRKSSGSVVNISSQASQAGLLNHTIYAASKGAVDAFSRTLALELGPKNIRVNCVNPTVVMTPLGLQAWSDPTTRYAMLAKIPLQRSIDILPCTEEVNENGMVLAQRLLEEAVPPGYRLIEIQPAVQTGRNPHRWECRFERLDNVYRFDCPYLTEVRTAFRRFSPRGCEISQVVVNVSPNRQFLTVEYMVNCGHTKIPRRRT